MPATPTSWIITITLSSADATAHIVENPYFPSNLNHNVWVDIAITAALIGSLGAVFLKGFKEAIGIAVLLAGAVLCARCDSKRLSPLVPHRTP